MKKDSTEIIDPKKPFDEQVHCCRNWPELAEMKNMDMETEEFSKELWKQIIEYDKDVLIDFKSSINFINNLHIPPTRKVYLTNSRGCLICHHDLIPKQLHYAMIKGYCDIKTIQYYLFSKGIWYKSCYLKQHLKHINVSEIEERKIIAIQKDSKIIEDQLIQVQLELQKYENLGGVQNDKTVITLRKQLLDLLTLKSNLDLGAETKNSMISFNDFFKKINDKNSNSKIINIKKEDETL